MTWYYIDIHGSIIHIEFLTEKDPIIGAFQLKIFIRPMESLPLKLRTKKLFNQF